MSTTSQELGGGIIAIPESVASDPRIVAKLEEIKGNDNPADQAQLTAAEDSDFELLEKYGIKPRQVGLRMTARLARIASFAPLHTVDGKEAREIPDEYMGHVGVFVVAAQTRLVVDAIEHGVENGFGAFMEKVDEWFESTNIPDEISQEAANEVGKIFTLAAKLSDATQGKESQKKMTSHGNMNAPEPSPPNTDGMKTISGTGSH